jgi:hypothetical protein
MNSIESNYLLRIKAGTWSKSVADKEGVTSIAAFQAEIQALKVAQDTNRSNESKTKADKEKYAWKKVAPKDGKSKSKPYED